MIRIVIHIKYRDTYRHTYQISRYVSSYISNIAIRIVIHIKYRDMYRHTYQISQYVSLVEKVYRYTLTCNSHYSTKIFILIFIIGFQRMGWCTNPEPPKYGCILNDLQWLIIEQKTIHHLNLKNQPSLNIFLAVHVTKIIDRYM